MSSNLRAYTSYSDHQIPLLSCFKVKDDAADIVCNTNILIIFKAILKGDMYFT